MISSASLLEQLQRTSPVPTRTVDLAGAPLRTAPRTLDAVVGAAGEALRNIARHAAEPSATLLLGRASSGGFELRVHHDGSPRDPERPVVHGFGIRESVLARMDDVGGQAEVHIDAHSSSVSLRWTADQLVGERAHGPGGDPGVVDAVEAPVGDLLRRLGSLAPLPPMWVVVLPMLVAQVYLGAVNPWPGRGLPVHVTAVTLLAALTVGLAQLLERRVPRPAYLVVIALALSLSTVASVLWVGVSTLTSLASWQVGFVSLPLALLAFHVPLRTLPWIVLPTPVLLAAVAALSPDVTVWQAAGAVNVCVLPLFAGGVAAGLRRAVTTAEYRYRQIGETAAAAAREESMSEARDRHLRHVEAEVLPWLEAVCSGAVDVDDPATALRASLLAQEARDDLYVPELFDDRLRALVREYRRRGGMVVVRPGVVQGTPDPRVADALAALVQQLPARHTVTVNRAPEGSVRLVVTPGVPRQRASALLGGTCSVHGDGYATEIWLHAPTTGSAPLRRSQPHSAREVDQHAR